MPYPLGHGGLCNTCHQSQKYLTKMTLSPGLVTPFLKVLNSIVGAAGGPQYLSPLWRQTGITKVKVLK